VSYGHCTCGPIVCKNEKNYLKVVRLSKKVRTFATRNVRKRVTMCNLERFKIDLKALTTEEQSYEWDLDDSYFEALEATEVQGGALHVSASIRKVSGFFELHWHAAGTVIVTCDRCLDAMDQPIEADQRLIVKFGTGHSEDDEVIVVDENEGVLDTAWLIYESIALAVPIQHVHQLGGCNDAMMRVLSEHSAARSSDADAKQTVDPRWAALLKLKE